MIFLTEGGIDMRNFFVHFMEMSIQASIAIILILLIRVLFAKMHLSKKYIMWLWTIPFLCLVLPWRISSPIGIWNDVFAKFGYADFLDNKKFDMQEEMTSNQVNKTTDVKEDTKSQHEVISNNFDFHNINQNRSYFKDNRDSTTFFVHLDLRQSYVKEIIFNKVPYRYFCQSLEKDTNLDTSMEENFNNSQADTSETSIPEFIKQLQSYFYFNKTKDETEQLLTIIMSIWGTVAVFLYLRSMILYRKLKKMIGCSILIRKEVFLTDAISTPIVIGIRNPKIYIPTGVEHTHLEYVIAHEQTHIARKDPFIKMTAYFITCLHWFNPLVWLGYCFMIKDMEMACDEETILRLGEGTKQAYATALLELSSKTTNSFSVPLAFGEGDTKQRILNILHFQKAKKSFEVIAIVIGIVIAGLFLTKAERNISQEDVYLQTENMYEIKGNEVLFMDDIEPILELDGNYEMRGDGLLYKEDGTCFYIKEDELVQYIPQNRNLFSSEFYHNGERVSLTFAWYEKDETICILGEFGDTYWVEPIEDCCTFVFLIVREKDSEFVQYQLCDLQKNQIIPFYETEFSSHEIDYIECSPDLSHIFISTKKGEQKFLFDGTSFYELGKLIKEYDNFFLKNQTENMDFENSISENTQKENYGVCFVEDAIMILKIQETELDNIEAVYYYENGKVTKGALEYIVTDVGTHMTRYGNWVEYSQNGNVTIANLLTGKIIRTNIFYSDIYGTMNVTRQECLIVTKQGELLFINRQTGTIQNYVMDLGQKEQVAENENLGKDVSLFEKMDLQIIQSEEYIYIGIRKNNGKIAIFKVDINHKQEEIEELAGNSQTEEKEQQTTVNLPTWKQFLFEQEGETIAKWIETELDCTVPNFGKWFTTYNQEKIQQVVVEDGTDSSYVTPAVWSDIIYYRAEEEDELQSVVKQMIDVMLIPLMEKSDIRPYTITEYELEEQPIISVNENVWLIPYIDGYYNYEGVDVVPMSVRVEEGTMANGMVSFMRQGSGSTFVYVLVRDGNVYRLQRAEDMMREER